MEDRVSVRFIREYKMEIDGKTTQFRVNDTVEIPKDQALVLFKQGIVLPAQQHGAPVPN